MGTFLDMRSSMNSSGTGAPNTALSPTPALLGLIGLDTMQTVGTVITLNGTVGVTGEVGDTFDVVIVRGSVFDPANIIYHAVGTVSQSGGHEFHSFTVQDLLAPPALITVYSSYISGVSTTVRSGPEVFYGIASTV